MTKLSNVSIYGDMSQYRAITEIRFVDKCYPDILEMANRLGEAEHENVTGLSARLLRESLAKIVAKKGLKINSNPAHTAA